MQVFVLGYPADVGGANTECWHTVKLWRQCGLDVTLIPHGKADEGWRQRLAGIGAKTAAALAPNQAGTAPVPHDLPGAVLVSFCNTGIFDSAQRLRGLGCRIVWVGCMNFLFAVETSYYRRHGVFDRYVFQSRYQRDQLQPLLRPFGYQDHQGCVIRGAFAWEEFPFRPQSHVPGEVFTVGRLSRAAPDKYARHSWQIYQRISHPLRVRVMGWSRNIERVVGRPPAWAEVLPAGAQTSQDFLATLHALVPISGRAIENWPRVGLEAMAAGVPVVAENIGGWPEMIRHAATGYLADTPAALAEYVSRLAGDEQHRQEVIGRARRALEEDLAEPQAIWAGWKTLLDRLG
jgi:hypothetical protein